MKRVMSSNEIKDVFEDGATVEMYRCCRTSQHAPLHPSTQRTMQHIHRTVSIILDRLDLDLSPPHVGSGSEGQVLMVVECFG